jgi:flagellar biosynthetic protein FliP
MAGNSNAEGATTMTTELTSNRRATSGARIRSRPNVRFALHFVEMMVAMFVGMFALAPVWSLAAPGLTERPDAHAIIMATNMSIGMAVWMWIRRHAWARIAEMSAAMYVPFLALLVPYWLGALSADGLMMLGHALMVPAMLAAMLWRRAEYSGQHHKH